MWEQKTDYMTDLQHKQLLVAQIFSSFVTINPQGYYEAMVDESIMIAEQIMLKTLPSKADRAETIKYLANKVGLDTVTEHNDY